MYSLFFAALVFFNLFNGFLTSDGADPNQISEKCIKDIEKWKTSLALLTTELESCSKTAIPETCEISKKTIFKENIWALYQFDSFGKIPSDLLGLNKVWMGDYDECLEVENPNDKEYQTQFCWAHLNLPVGKLLATSGDVSKPLSTTCGAGHVTDVKTSVCMPRSCTPSELKIAINQLSILPLPIKNQSIIWQNSSAELACEVTCRPTEFQPDTLFYAFTVILVATVSTCILATLADFYQESNEQKLAEKNEKIDKNLIGRTGFFKYFLAFSLMTNGRSLLRVSKNPNNLKGVECIRFISFTWVISGHIWGYMQDSDNTLKTLNILKNRDYEIWVNAFFSVDTFFFLSGLMLAYSFLPKLTIQKALSPPVWVIFYIHRFLRLTPAYLTFMMFYATYGLLTDFGPNESVRTQDMKDCRLYGWKNLLYINNIYEPRKYCMGISWYLAADTQMYLISPFFLVAFLLGPIPGLICCALIIFVSTLLNYWLFLRYSLPLTLIQAHMTGDQNIIHLLQDLVYEAAYIRIPPFIFGIIMGYILWKTRDQQRRIRMNIGLVFLLWIVAVCLALGSIFTIFSYNRGDYWTPLERASYYAFSRIAWSLALCWVIFAINRGYSGLIGKFMSLKFWTPLGKLTFCGYLCHILVVAAILNMERTPMHFVGPLHTYISKVLPAVICTCVLAAAWTLVFEMPFAKLEGFLIQRMAGGRGKVAPEKEKPECTKI